MLMLLRIVAAVLAAIVFSLTYLIMLALESGSERQVGWTGAVPAQSSAPVPSDRGS